jgi:hypothetical protein
MLQAHQRKVLTMTRHRRTPVLLASAILLGTALQSVSNPTLTPGTWVDVGPSQVSFGNNVFTQGLAIDPTNPSIIYLCVNAFDVSQAGFFKTTDGGSSWRRTGDLAHDWCCATRQDHPIRVRVNPNDPNHLYCGAGVRGGANGFWVSHDGGETWSCPQSFQDWANTTGSYDVYDVAVDPTDFDHLLLSFHNPWRIGDAGIVESTDGGDTWITHEAPQGGGWYAGMSIHFLYVPSQGIGNSDIWLTGTQGAGYWRTSNGGNTFTKVSNTCIQHGGGTIYYTAEGVLYASGNPRNLRSTDNGVTWTEIGPSGGFNCIFGDGTMLYTMKCFGPAPMIVAPEDNDNNWSDFNSQQFVQGPFEMALDAENGIVYNANWQAGFWALKLEYATAGERGPSPGAKPQAAAGNRISSVANERATISLRDAPAGSTVDVYDVKGALLRRSVVGRDGMVRIENTGRQALMVQIR